MNSREYRIEQDSMGEIRVPKEALYGAQTQRAVDNFPISGWPMPRAFLSALGLVKKATARVNAELELLDPSIADAIAAAAEEVSAGTHDREFPIDVFQTGSGTSTNMNANEVIAKIASQKTQQAVHPNDHVNMSQSSNDVIPTTLHVSAYLTVENKLLPALETLRSTIQQKAETVDDVVKTGRTHLMDAMPVRLSQELQAWAQQIAYGSDRLKDCQQRLSHLAQGATAVGTGINAPPEFAGRFAEELSNLTSHSFQPAPNPFTALACQDTVVELSGALRTIAVSLMKIANDLRWMNSGPQAGLAEIALPALQPGSSIMPGKVNPVIPEAVCMVAAQVIGNDTAVTVAGQAGNFQLNVMLPVIAWNVLNSIEILGNACSTLAEKAIEGFTVNQERIAELLDKNPILVTALNPVIGYEQGAKVAKTAYTEGRRVKDVAAELTDLKSDELDRLLDPKDLTEGGIKK